MGDSDNQPGSWSAKLAKWAIILAIGLATVGGYHVIFGRSDPEIEGITVNERVNRENFSYKIEGMRLSQMARRIGEWEWPNESKHRDALNLMLHGVPRYSEWSVAAVPYLLDLLASSNSQARSNVLNSVGDFIRAASRHQEFVEQREPLILAVTDIAANDPDEAVREAAVRQFIGFHPRTARVAEALAQFLTDPSVRVRRSTATAFGHFEQDAVPVVPALVAALDDPDGEVVTSIMHALHYIGPSAAPAVPKLIRFLDDGSVERRSSAASTLGDIGPAAEGAIPRLTALLRSEADSRYRATIAQALAGIGPRAAPAIPMIKEAAAAELDERRRRDIYEALAKLEGSTPSGVEALRRTIASGEASARRAAAEQLKGLGPQAASAISELRAALGDADEFTRVNALEALAGIGSQAAPGIPEILRCLRDESQWARRNAARVLGSIGEAARPHVGDLVKALDDEEEGVRRASASAIAKIGVTARSEGSDSSVAYEGKSLPFWIQSLSSADSSTRLAAARALAELGPKAGDALPALVRAAQDPDDAFAKAAALAIQRVYR